MMRNFILIFLVLTLFVINNQTTNAQEKRLNSSPQSFRKFFSDFRRAIEKSDKTKVAAMTRFPFEYAFDAGDEGTMTKPEFLKNFKRIFGESPKEFLTEKNPLFSRGDAGSYDISTDDAGHLIFVKKGNSFQFIGLFVEP